MSIKIPSINVKTKKTTDTAGKVRRYTPPTRAKLLNTPSSVLLDNITSPNLASWGKISQLGAEFGSIHFHHLFGNSLLKAPKDKNKAKQKIFM